MSIDNLKEALPEYAKDLKLNLGSISRTTALTEEQLWGTLLASAAATRNAKVIAEIAEEAKEHLSEEAVEAAYGAATVMAMNNVAYRTRHFLGSAYENERMGLRMNIIAKPGVEKANFELWNTVVSAINGCEHCAVAHANTVREEGVTKEQVWEAVKVAGVVQAVAQAITIEDAR